MLVINQSYMGPLRSLRTALSNAVHATFDQVAGAVTSPLDQPNAILVLSNLTHAITSYTATLGKCTPVFESEIAGVQSLASELKTLSERDWTPVTQLVGRHSKHLGWRLLMLLQPWHTQISVALGAEVVHAVLHNTKISEDFCKNLISDLQKISAPDAASSADEQDLVFLNFGKRWFGHFSRIDQAIRRLVEVPDPDKPGKFIGEFRAALKAQAEIRQRFLFPNMKHRAGVSNHRHISINQLKQVTASLREAVGKGEPEALCIVIQMLTCCMVDTVLNLPLEWKPDSFWTAAINIRAGVLELNLDSIFPSRRRPQHGTEDLYLPSGSVLRTPLPEFTLKQLISRHQNKPDAQCLGDLLDWPLINTRLNLLQGQPSRITPSIARAVHSLGLGALEFELPRNLAGPLTWDYSLLPSARAYYLRLSAESIETTWCDYLQDLGWSVQQHVKDHLLPSGSMCCLTDAAVKQLFAHLSDVVRKSGPGRNAGMDRLITHHNYYAIFITALVVFCTGLRDRVEYQINARDWRPDSIFALVNDKAVGQRSIDRPALLGGIVQAALADWRAHCRALRARLLKSCAMDAKDSLSQHLLGIENNQPIPLLFIVVDGKPIPMGHQHAWGMLPSNLAAVPNCGRPYWLNNFANAGCYSFELDLFMRHSAVGLESEASTFAGALGPVLAKLSRIQDEKIRQLIPAIPSGLRRAA